MDDKEYETFNLTRSQFRALKIIERETKIPIEAQLTQAHAMWISRNSLKPGEEMKQKISLITDKRTDPTDKLLTIAEVAKACQCSEAKVKEWLKSARLAYVILGDGKKYNSMLRVRESSLIKFWKEAEGKAR